ncbi:hypothetical protein HBO23_32870 [Pseudomonas sp. WS 5532]|uniref:hypothetical protein n=1 Tax=Pseudomonas sp. WS 5532 TaxID=2717495 RepID=UPI00147475B4|nr:hypothetical protein [Pseudomonas sp. WS 5532]NMX77763.1 hypothetical protein [Pseudomonas sp. WS 5532]
MKAWLVALKANAKKLNEAIWAWAAERLGQDERLRNKLFRYAASFPYEPLPGYMKRWWLVRPTRITWLRRLQPFTVRFHWIEREDRDPHCHDHPWAFRTLILHGWYTEELMSNDGSISSKNRIAGDSYRRELGQFHRISRVSPGGVLTLVIIGKKRDSWGFKVEDARIDWRSYPGVDAVDTPDKPLKHL